MISAENTKNAAKALAEMNERESRGLVQRHRTAALAYKWQGIDPTHHRSPREISVRFRSTAMETPATRPGLDLWDWGNFDPQCRG